MSLTYATLQDLLIQREERTQQWRNDLFDQAVDFSGSLKEKLLPPDAPITLPSGSETRLPFQLGEPVDTIGQPKVCGELCNPGFEKFISKGALSFSVTLSFEKTDPIRSIVCSCMVRFHDGQPKFGFGKALEAVSNWYTLDDAVSAFLERIEAAYHSDSYARSDEPPVGFVHLQAET